VISYKKHQKKTVTSLAIIYLMTASWIYTQNWPMVSVTEPARWQAKERSACHMSSNIDQGQNPATSVASIVSSLSVD
jgi:hypothetical protein